MVPHDTLTPDVSLAHPIVVSFPGPVVCCLGVGSLSVFRVADVEFCEQLKQKGAGKLDVGCRSDGTLGWV